MSREKNLWAWMHVHGRAIPDLAMYRVENGLMRGMADVVMCYAGREPWVELKGAKRPVKPTTPIRFELTDFQIRWLTRWWSVGGLSWVYIRVGEGPRISRYVLCPGEPGLLERAQAGMTEAALADASDLPPNHTFREALARFCSRLDYPHR